MSRLLERWEPCEVLLPLGFVRIAGVMSYDVHQVLVCFNWSFMGSDPWSHSNKEWAEALQLAKRAGWDPPLERTNHKIKELICPNGEHRIKIFSTGRNAEAVAKNARKIISRCQHGDFSDTIGQIKENLDKAETLIVAAETLVAKKAALVEASELMEQADLIVEAAQARINDSRFDEVSRAIDEHTELLETLEVDGVAVSHPQEITIKAERHTRLARLMLRDSLPNQHETYDSLEERLSDFRHRILTLKQVPRSE